MFLVFRVTHRPMRLGVYLDHYCFVLLFKNVTQAFSFTYCFDISHKYITFTCEVKMYQDTCTTNCFCSCFAKLKVKC